MTELHELNKRFVYKSDSGRIDNWRIIKSPVGAIYGDCEDYSLTLIWLLEGKSMSRYHV